MSDGKAQKLLERMRNTNSGWGQSDFKHLFEGFGFNVRGTKHAIYYHPEYPELWMSVPRHNSLKEWVARDAVKVIDELAKLKKLKEESNANSQGA